MLIRSTRARSPAIRFFFVNIEVVPSSKMNLIWDMWLATKTSFFYAVSYTMDHLLLLPRLLLPEFSMQEPTIAQDIRTVVCLQAQNPNKTGIPCSKCAFMFDTCESPFQGGQCDIYAVTDHSGRCLCVRVHREPGSGSTYLLKKEIEYRKEIDKNKIQYYQRLISFSSEEGNSIGRPYLMLSWAFGQQLHWTDTSLSLASNRELLIAAVAQSTIDLIKYSEQVCRLFIPL